MDTLGRNEDCSTLRDLLQLKTIDNKDHERKITTWKERDRSAVRVIEKTPTVPNPSESAMPESMAEDLNKPNEPDDAKLAEISVKQLNQMLQGCDKAVVNEMKQKRRTLKNRGYALRCRMKRMEVQSKLEMENEALRKQNVDLQQEVTVLRERLHWYESYQREYERSGYPAQGFNITYSPEDSESFGDTSSGTTAQPSTSSGDLQSTGDALVYSLYADSDSGGLDPYCPWGHIKPL